MRRHFIPPLSEIDLGNPVSVQRITLVGVDNHHKEARVGVDKLGLVACLQVPEDRGIIKEGQVDHVLNLLKLGRVNFAYFRSFVGELLVADRNHTFAGRIIIRITRLQETLAISLSLGIRDPHRLPGIIGLSLVSPLHLNGGDQELSGIGVHGTLGELDMARHSGSYT